MQQTITKKTKINEEEKKRRRRNKVNCRSKVKNLSRTYADNIRKIFGNGKIKQQMKEKLKKQEEIKEIKSEKEKKYVFMA